MAPTPAAKPAATNIVQAPARPTNAPAAVPKKPAIIKGKPTIRRVVTPVPESAPTASTSVPDLSAEQIASRLAQGFSEAVAGQTISGSGTSNDAWTRYYQQLHALFDAQWVQPGGLGVIANNAVEVELRVEPGGRIISKRLVAPSGIAALDASVQAALDAVSALPPLPETKGLAHQDIRILFQLEGSR